MRVTKIGQIELCTHFSGKKKSKNTLESPKDKSHKYNCKNNRPFESAYFKHGLYQSTLCVNNNRDLSKNYFDLKNFSPNGAKTADKKPKSFDESDGRLTLDKYQKEAINAFNNGETVFVSAPTGTGKTLIAEYAIKKALDENKKVIYLSPLKALSNEKYTRFSELFGTYDEKGNLIDTKNVGLMTGDETINPNAPLLVMTTEIYKNSLLLNSKDDIANKYKDCKAVIYDEFHYINDKSRGVVWEEAVMNTPSNMQQMFLTATASNAAEILNWVSERNGAIPVRLISVPESERFVPLQEYVLTQNVSGDLELEQTKEHFISFENMNNLSDRQKMAFSELKEIMGFNSNDEAVSMINDLKKSKNAFPAEALANALMEHGAEESRANGISLVLSDTKHTKTKKFLNNNFAPYVKTSNVAQLLNEKQMTPALFYVFSKKGCESNLEYINKTMPSMLTKEESEKVYQELQKCKENGIFLGADFDEEAMTALMKGFAVHHAGRLPAYKSLVEKLAREGLIKVCFATETLIAGIDMPFRTTVFTSLEKFDGDEVVDISPQIFKQGAGRAGRRGKDDIGNVVIIPQDYQDYCKYLELTNSKNTSIKSKYKISYASLLSDAMLQNSKKAMSNSLGVYQNKQRHEKYVHEAHSKLDILKRYDYVIEKNGALSRTPKGEIAKRVFGVNEMVLTELLTGNYLKDFKSGDLIALCVFLADTKEEHPRQNFKGSLAHLNEAFVPIKSLIDVISAEEEYAFGGAQENYNTVLAPYVLEFSKAKNNKEALIIWSNIIEELSVKNLLTHEGDLLRVVNGAIDILKLIYELSPNASIRNEAKIAIESLEKSPVADIRNYELSGCKKG